MKKKKIASDPSKFPFIIFYTQDWRTDIKVMSLSNRSRHIWLEIIFIMNTCEERGKLMLNGEPIDIILLSRMVNYSVDETQESINEILKKGVGYIDKQGIIYNKRLVGDTRKAMENRINGAKGGNPELKGSGKKEQPENVPEVDDSEKEKMNEDDQKRLTPMDNPAVNPESAEGVKAINHINTLEVITYELINNKEKESKEKTPETGLMLAEHPLSDVVVLSSKKVKGNRKEFIAPALHEIQEYAGERGFELNANEAAQKFFDYYDPANWYDRDGRKVVSWKQKFVSWENRGLEKLKSQPGSNIIKGRIFPPGYTLEKWDKARDLNRNPVILYPEIFNGYVKDEFGNYCKVLEPKEIKNLIEKAELNNQPWDYFLPISLQFDTRIYNNAMKDKDKFKQPKRKEELAEWKEYQKKYAEGIKAEAFKLEEKSTASLSIGDGSNVVNHQIS